MSNEEQFKSMRSKFDELFEEAKRGSLKKMGTSTKSMVGVYLNMALDIYNDLVFKNLPISFKAHLINILLNKATSITLNTKPTDSTYISKSMLDVFFEFLGGSGSYIIEIDDEPVKVKNKKDLN